MVMVDLTVYLKKVKMSFIMHYMTTTEVIGVVNYLDKDQIYGFLKHFFLPKLFFP